MPSPTVPRLNVITPSLGSAPPVAEMKVVAAGNVSVTITPFAAVTALLVTVIVYTKLIPTVAGSTESAKAIERSGAGTSCTMAVPDGPNAPVNLWLPNPTTAMRPPPPLPLALSRPGPPWARMVPEPAKSPPANVIQIEPPLPPPPPLPQQPAPPSASISPSTTIEPASMRTRPPPLPPVPSAQQSSAAPPLPSSAGAVSLPYSALL